MVVSNMLLRVANVVLTAIIAHILSPGDFGVYAVALTVYTIVSSFGELGVSSCLIRADLDIDELAPTVLTVSLLSSAVLADAMAFSAGPIARALGTASAVAPIRVMAFAVLLLGAFAVPNAQLTRDFKQDKIFLANAVGFIPATVLLIVLAKSGDGAMAFAWSTVVRQLAVGCTLVAVVPRRYWPGFTRASLSVLLRFGIPLAGANFVNYTLLNVDYAFVGHLLGAIALGVYMLAFTVASWPYGLLGGVINSVAMPAISRVKHDPELLEKAIAAGLRGVTLVVMPMCAVMLVLARPLILTFYGVKWAGSANVLAILSLYGVTFMTCLLFANILTGLGRTKLLLVLQVIWIATLFPAMALGVHVDGITGAAYAHVAVIFPIVLPSYLLVLRRVTGVRLSALARAVLPALLGSAAAALAARAAASQFSSPPAQLMAGLAAAGITYAACAGRQVTVVLAQGRGAQRLLRWYAGVARLAGLPVNGRSKPRSTV